MITRVLQETLLKAAAAFPVVTVTGPRQSGKTTLARMCFPEYEYRNLEDPSLRAIAAHDPKGFLQTQAKGIILDEFQKQPELASYIQVAIDEDNTPGRFILTGSQHLEVSRTVSQSLAGRTAVLRLLPLSYSELYGESRVPVDELLFGGFFPRIFDQRQDPSLALESYLRTYIERDLRDISQVHNLRQFQQFLKLCAAQVGQIVNFSRIGNDIGVNYKTIQSWLSILEASFIIFLLPPYHRNFRKRVVKSPKLYFYDVGLAAHLLGVSTKEHIATIPTKGSLFENFVVMDILKELIHTNANTSLYFYRDSNGHEIDLILEQAMSTIAVEIKMSQTYSTDFTNNLSRYATLDTHLKKQFIIYSGEDFKLGDGRDMLHYSRGKHVV